MSNKSLFFTYICATVSPAIVRAGCPRERTMSMRGMFAALVALGLTGVAAAETLSVGDQVTIRDTAVNRPTRGMSMSAVESRFGAPASRHNAVGEPPITRWDYPDFSVFFEREYVIHSVVTRS